MLQVGELLTGMGDPEPVQVSLEQTLDTLPGLLHMRKNAKLSRMSVI